MSKDLRNATRSMNPASGSHAAHYHSYTKSWRVTVSIGGQQIETRITLDNGHNRVKPLMDARCCFDRQRIQMPWL
jgi:hypothetical protein